MARPIVNPYSRFLREELGNYWNCPDRKNMWRQSREFFGLWRDYKYFPYQYIQSRLYENSFEGDIRKYLPTKLIQHYRNARNPPDARQKAHNKALFYAALFEAGVYRFPATIRTLKDGTAVDLAQKPLSASALEAFFANNGPRLFFKPVIGRMGQGARIEDISLRDCHDLSPFPDHLIQNVIIQHPHLSELYPHSVNTIRIDTWITDDGTCVHNAAVQRMGMNGSIIDNWAAGGLATGIDLESGRLYPRGRRKNKFSDPTMYDRHPETGAVFTGRRVPYWEEVKALTKEAAALFSPLRSIGWDVAIAQDGPLLIEANVGWHVDFMQQIWGGMADTPLGRAARSNAASPIPPRG